MSRATNDAMDSLHGLLSEVLIDQLKAAKNARDADGNALPMPPALLAQCIKFLKDNGIDSPARAAKMLDTLKGSIPEFDDMDDNPMGAH